MFRTMTIYCPRGRLAIGNPTGTLCRGKCRADFPMTFYVLPVLLDVDPFPVCSRVVDAKYSTALIMEDDADWDVSLKSQLVQFADATRKIENRQRPEDDQLGPHNRTLTPYGSTWDLLWLGICANPQDPSDAELFPGVDDGEPFWVYPVTGGMACTFAYGVTQKNAQLLLEHLADTNRPTDLAMSTFCQDSERKCLLVWPMLISSYKAAGSSKKDSDIKHSAKGEGEVGEQSPEVIREKGESFKIKHSAIVDALEKSGISKNATAPES